MSYIVIHAGPSDPTQASEMRVEVYRFADREEALRFADRGNDHALGTAQAWGGYPDEWRCIDVDDADEYGNPDEWWESWAEQDEEDNDEEESAG